MGKLWRWQHDPLPQFTNDNRCQVASPLADCSVHASSSELPSLQRVLESASGQPRDHRHAIVNKRRRNQSVDELKTLLKSYLPNQEEPTTLRIAAYKPAPAVNFARCSHGSQDQATPASVRPAPKHERLGRGRMPYESRHHYRMAFEEAQLRGLPQESLLEPSPSHSCSLPSAV